MKFLDVPQSGSIAGTVHSHNRAGQYTRNRRSPVQPVGTGRRATVRANFTAASAAWAGLTSIQRGAWDSFANSHPITDSLGQSVTLTGHQMYVRVSSSCLNVGGTPPTLPPSDLTLPTVGTASFVFSVASGVSIDDFSGPAGGFVAFGFSQPFSAGRGFNKTFWQPPSGDGFADAAGAPYGYTTAKYAAQFGAPIAGQRVFARLTPISTDFWNGAPAIMSTIVVA